MSSTRSLLQCFLEQQAGGLPGIRFSFHPCLAQPLVLCKDPFHFCAVENRISLAVYLYSQGLGAAAALKALPVATVASDGVDGGTRWSKTMGLAARDAALLAGHRDMADLLGLMESGQPLRWSCSVHTKLPDPFRQEVQRLVSGLCSAPWFCALPGPARHTLVNAAVQQLYRTSVWRMVPRAAWVMLDKGQSPPVNNADEAAALLGLLSSVRTPHGEAPVKVDNQHADGSGVVPGTEAVMFEMQVDLRRRNGLWQRSSRLLGWLRKGLPIVMAALAVQGKGILPDRSRLALAYLAGVMAGNTLTGAVLANLVGALG